MIDYSLLTKHIVLLSLDVHGPNNHSNNNINNNSNNNNSNSCCIPIIQANVRN